MKIAIIFGTRPEAIKMAPVVHALRRAQVASRSVETLVWVTGQHRGLLDQVLSLFAIEPDQDLDAMRPGQQLADLTARLIEGLDRLLERSKPDLVLVQGDTTTALAGALASYYRRVPVGHVEAGLRTRNRYSPFPEEMNRQLVDALSVHHFAPTNWAADNLTREGIDPAGVVVTGNTAIDALRITVDRLGSQVPDRLRSQHPDLFRLLDRYPEFILVTSHRRENFGPGLEGVYHALVDLMRVLPDMAIVFPVHPNPNVRRATAEFLSGRERIFLTEPLDYDLFCYLMAASRLILTDSGGIQEEAPSLNKPVLVLRDTSERPEAIEAGAALLVGTERNRIVEAVAQLLSDPAAYRRMSEAVNPYGDGHAARRIVDHLLDRESPPEFVRAGGPS